MVSSEINSHISICQSDQFWNRRAKSNLNSRYICNYPMYVYCYIVYV